MIVVNIQPFVITRHGDIGIADGGTFASKAWCISDEAFEAVHGAKFSWIAPDGSESIDNREYFFRPTEEQLQNMTILIKNIAAARGLIKV